MSVDVLFLCSSVPGFDDCEYFIISVLSNPVLHVYEGFIPRLSIPVFDEY